MSFGSCPLAALRSAQVSMWREARWWSPRKWAAFVHQGDWLCPKL
jgi:CHAT domain-containing protein